MSDGPDWFRPKRYGYGAGLPLKWQGWVLTIAFMAIAVVAAMLAARKPLVFIGIIIPLTVGFTVIAARTTKGGWRWRWGDKE